MSYGELVEQIWDSVSIYDGPEKFLEQYMAESEAPRVLFAACWCHGEVCNGGFEQFFFNDTGVLAPEAVEAFRKLAMPQIAALLEQAMSLLGPNYPRDRDERYESMTMYSGGPDPYEQLDDMFFKLIRTENGGFDAAADAYANSHI